MSRRLFCHDASLFRVHERRAPASQSKKYVAEWHFIKHLKRLPAVRYVKAAIGVCVTHNGTFVFTKIFPSICLTTAQMKSPCPFNLTKRKSELC